MMARGMIGFRPRMTRRRKRKPQVPKRQRGGVFPLFLIPLAAKAAAAGALSGAVGYGVQKSLKKRKQKKEKSI